MMSECWISRRQEAGEGTMGSYLDRDGRKGPSRCVVSLLGFFECGFVQGCYIASLEGGRKGGGEHGGGREQEGDEERDHDGCN